MAGHTDKPKDMHLTVQNSTNEIDAVYLWVNGADRIFQEALSRFLPPARSSPVSEDISPKRFRDNGELRYSLRSLERYAPWIRRIHLVTNGQAPGWLTRSNPKITVVPHELLFLDKQQLPTFNSNAIELQLHRIPDLTPRFLYLNDDVFLGAPTAAEMFFLPNGMQQFFVQETPVHNNMDAGSVHDRSYAYTQQVISKAWGWDPPRLLPAHAPQLYDKTIIAEIEQSIPKQFAQTSSNRFRSANDLVLRVLYASYILQNVPGGRRSETVLRQESRDYCHAMLGRSVAGDIRHLVRIARLRPRFFCINDDVDDAIGARLLLRILPVFLRGMFPDRSSFETEGVLEKQASSQMLSFPD